jgi:glycosyltransferase involved in cell wall biosynthesis
MSERLAIVMFMREFYPLTGGYQNQALRLAQEMVGRNVTVHVVTHRHRTLPPHEVYKQIHIHRVPALKTGHIAALSFLASALLWMAWHRQEFQLIHANRSSSGLIAGIIGFVLRKKVLYKLTRGDEIDIKGFRGGLWGRLKLIVLKSTVTRFVAITREIESDLKRLGIPSNQIVRIPNGIGPPPWSVPYEREKVRAEFGWDADTRLVTFVGRLVHAKGVDWLLEVWQQVTQRESKARLLIVGDGEERRSLEGRSHALGITNSVVFVGEQKDVWRFFSISDVFVLPSRREGISNALLEAMSLGLPVIVTDDTLGGNREVVDNPADGCIVQFGDTKTFVETLLKLVHTSDLRKAMGIRGQRAIEERFSLKSVADRYYKLYRQLLGQEVSSATGIKRPSIGIFLARPDRSFFMVRKLRQRGFEVDHYYDTKGYKEDSDWIKVRKGFLPSLMHLLFRTDHDIYFASLSFVPSLSVYLNRVLRGKPYVFNSTGVKWEMFKDRSRGKPFSNVLEARLYPFLLKRVFAGASRIVCNSHFLETTLAQRYPKYRERLLTIYNGIEFERYAFGQRQSLSGIVPGGFTFICVTSLDFENKSKGLHLVIDAFGLVVAKHPGARLVVAANAGEPRYSNAAEAYLLTKPWRDSVTLLYNQNNIPDLLASSDIFLYATPNNSNDSLPRALLEAQSAGLPTVTTNTTGCAEIVRDGVTGFVVPYDAQAMAERSLQLVDNPGLRSDMRREAQQWVKSTFNWDQMADKYADLFQQIAGDSDTRFAKPRLGLNSPMPLI